MYNVLHSAVAASVALPLLSGNPPLAFLFGWATHYLLDALPHGDETDPEILADRPRFVRRIVAFGAVDFSLLAALCALWVFLHGWSWTLAAAVAGSALPDVMLGLGYLLGRPDMFGFFDRLHHRLHNFLGIAFSPALGLAVQAALAGLLWWRLLIF